MFHRFSISSVFSKMLKSRDLPVFMVFLIISFVFWSLNAFRKDHVTNIRFPVVFTTSLPLCLEQDALAASNSEYSQPQPDNSKTHKINAYFITIPPKITIFHQVEFVYVRFV